MQRYFNFYEYMLRIWAYTYIIFEKEYPKKKYDRSQIIEDLLRKFLADNGKI